MASDYELRVHRDWIGPLQPIGLVVSPPALLAAQAFPDKNILQQQQALIALVTQLPPKEGEKSALKRTQLPLRFEQLATEVLGWKANKLAGATTGPALPDNLALVLPEFGETLRPTYAVPAPKEDDAEWILLIQELSDNTSFDEAPQEEPKKWSASPQARIERLLRETGVPIGILINGRSVRLIFAPRGESSGHVTWPVYALCEVAGRMLLSALCMLLGSARLFTLPRDQRLPHILRESRKYQNVVSTKLAGQVLEALNELLRGFQSANDAVKGKLLHATVREDPDHVYGGLLAVLLRFVFILYAEERGLLSSSATYIRNYSLVALFEKLRVDAGRFPDTMDQRYGAWSRLLVLFRMVHDGAKRGDLHLPPRYGHLFDPDGWAFLEGRAYRVNRVMGASVDVPKVPDGVVLRVLEKLLLLDRDRLSYRALDVEQIGSVYENMMGFRLELALETSIGVGKQHVVVGLETLLAKKGVEREKHLKEAAGVELSGKAAESLRQAGSVDDIVAALGRRISPLTPRPVPLEAIYLQPTDERRSSGSHYTPRELTEPIVRTTLLPVLQDLGTAPKPDQLLALRICDPAMGSGAFLVETCRQLAEQLVNAYAVHGRPNDVPPDEDILLYAQRQVAQHCLYGVDKNPFAVDLGKLSLWLATLARNHAFTFLDHSIRHGDSLVGLSREQIASFHWAPKKQISVIRAFIDKAIAEALMLREKIATLASSDDVHEKRQLLRDADAALARVRLIGDVLVASYFSEEKPAAREEARRRWETRIQTWLAAPDPAIDIAAFVDKLCSGEKPVPCFHWEVEFPEVFMRGAGFDAVIGNPPFAGKNTIAAAHKPNYIAWLGAIHVESHGASDLVAYFFRGLYEKLRSGGALGFIATKTISQGDTRSTGLRYLCLHGGVIFSARRRLKWPGSAAVVVSVVHVRKRLEVRPVLLDGVVVERISAFLVHRGGDEDPKRLPENAGLSFQGPIALGMGFTFDDNNAKGETTSIAEMHRLLKKNPRNGERIFPYLGGEEILESPTQEPHRYIINFEELSEREARRWPDLMDIVESKVRPQREAQKDKGAKERWWQFIRPRGELNTAIAKLDRVLAHPFVSKWPCFAFVPAKVIIAGPANVFALPHFTSFAALASRPHDIWARFFSSSLEDRPRYNPSDCFETFPFPPGWISQSSPLEAVGRSCYEFRAEIMVRSGQGVTETYNRFHDPDERAPEICKLREMHASLDLAMLDAYGWTDIKPSCEFLLDYEEEDDESEPTIGRRRKKPWRYRWPDDVRDEVLARLLELNAERAKPPTLSTTGGGIPDNRGEKRSRHSKSKKAGAASGRLSFDGESK